MNVDNSKYPDIEINKYGNVSITGNIHSLDENQTYNIIAYEKNDNYGISYQVVNIRTSKPLTLDATHMFLKEILSAKQAKILYENYPNIVDLILDEKEDEIDLSKLKGIKGATFEKIKTKIFDNFAFVDLIDEFQGAIPLNVIKKIYETYPSVEKVRQEILNEPYKCLCSLSGIGFITADKLLLEMEKSNIVDFGYDLCTSKQRCMQCILHILEENEKNGHTKMDVTELRLQCEKVVFSSIDYFVECIKSPDIYYTKSGNRVYVSRQITYETECYLANVIKKVINEEQLAYQADEKDYESVHGIPLANKQKQGIKMFLANTFSILNGAAGTGKSYTTIAIMDILNAQSKSYLMLAPTGKAAKVVSEYTDTEAKTIHRGLAFRPPRTWVYNKHNKLDYDTIIIDEFSMVDISLCRKLFEAIDFTKTKILIIGDDAQLPSVQCGNLLYDFLLSKKIPSTTLDEVFRYGEGGLMKVATDVRLGKQYLVNSSDTVTYYGSNKDYAFINVSQNQMLKSVIGLYQKVLLEHNPDDIYVLTAYKKGELGSINLSNALQKIANSNYGGENYTEVKDLKAYEKDLVMQVKNNYKARIYDKDSEVEELAFIANGETGVVKKVEKDSVIIDFSDYVVEYKRAELSCVNLGYAMTIHKSQGSSNKIVILVTPPAHTYMLNSNLLYVGLTRMKNTCYHIGTVDTVNRAITKKANLERNTWMRQLLNSSYSKKQQGEMNGENYK